MSEHGEMPIKHALTEEQHRRNAARAQRRQQLQAERKKLQPAQRSAPPRRKHVTPVDPDEWDDVDVTRYERVMPRDESERRRSIARAASRGSASATHSAHEHAPAIAGPRGLVVEVSTGMCRVDLGDRVLLCRVRGSLSSRTLGFTNPVAVGDEVIVREDGADGGFVEAVAPRRSMLARPDVFRSHLQQVIVANVDQLLIVAAWREPTIWLELVDRYLIAAERDHLQAIICVNKVDLATDEAEVESTLHPYRALGYTILTTSAHTGAGIGALQAALVDRTTVLAGLSGVGKSSLLSAVQPGLHLRTSAVGQHTGEGRHTTTQATLHRLLAGGAVVDTPGIREFGLSGLRQHELASFFPELITEAERCRFGNCTHIGEPECAVQAAVATGAIAASRYHSYRQIHAALPA